MVLEVFVEGCDESMECRYSGFSKFRCEILRGWNEELGKLYEKRYSFIWEENDELNVLGLTMFLSNQNDQKSLDEKIKQILNEFDIPNNEGMKLFYNHSDCEGIFTPSECELILKSFQHVDCEKFDKSDEDIYEWLKETYNIWLKMLKYAIENNKNIVFG